MDIPSYRQRLERLIQDGNKLFRADLRWISTFHDAYVEEVVEWQRKTIRFIEERYGRDSTAFDDFNAMKISLPIVGDCSNKLQYEVKFLKGCLDELKGCKSMRECEYDVFLSYAHEDSAFVQELHDELDRLGVNVWHDVSCIEWGDDWKEKIFEGLEKCRFGIVILSRDFLKKEWPRTELMELLNRQNASSEKVVLPLLYNLTVEEMGKANEQLQTIQAIRINEQFGAKDVIIAFAKQLICSLKKA